MKLVGKTSLMINNKDLLRSKFHIIVNKELGSMC